jgi:hypothetical protein
VTEQSPPPHNFEVQEHHHNYFAGTNGVLVHNGDPHPEFKEFTGALKSAIDGLEARDCKAEKQVLAKMRLDPMYGKPVGMSTADGKMGFRVEFDPNVGAHIYPNLSILASLETMLSTGIAFLKIRRPS